MVTVRSESAVEVLSHVQSPRANGESSLHCGTSGPHDHPKRIGEWEGDTVIGNGYPGALVTLVDRRSKYSVHQSVPHNKAVTARPAVTRVLRLHKASVHTITYDNGREFSEHAEMVLAVDATTYFAHPYASWDGGERKHQRTHLQIFPQRPRSDFGMRAGIQPSHVSMNHRPRKTVGFCTHHGVSVDATINVSITRSF